MNTPKTLWIKFNEKTHKPEYIGIEEPAENGFSVITNIAGDPNAILKPVKDCDTCELYLNNKCDPNEMLATDCPFDKEEETQ
jgi:hypothetical protein